MARINKKLILHIGLHKTGTSAIQKALFQNRELLREDSVNYPDSGKFEAHHALAATLRSTLSGDQKKQNYIKSFEKYAACEEGTVVISSEIFSESEDLNALSVLGDIFSEISLVAYLRRQDLLLESAYGQLVKQNGEVRKINEFKPYMSNLFVHLERFKEVIPSAKFILRNYDKKDLYEGDSAKDFFINVLGLNVEKYIWQEEKVNHSLSSVGVELLRKLNKFDVQDRNEVVRDVLQSCRELPERFNKSIAGGLYSSKDREQLLLECQASNKMLSSEYGFEMSAVSESVEVASVEESDVLELAIEMLAKKIKSSS